MSYGCTSKRVAGAELGEQREVTVSRQQLVHAVRHAYCGDAGVVDDPSHHAGLPGEAAQSHQEVLRLANQAI